MKLPTLVGVVFASALALAGHGHGHGQGHIPALEARLGRRLPLQSRLARRQSSATLATRDVDPVALYPNHTIQVPIDHFHNDSRYEPHSGGTFALRYWFDASHYQPGGPVIMLHSGELAGEYRLPFLQKGILAQLAAATHGVAVVIEHRYTGNSILTPDLSTPNLRFLTMEQAMADTAFVAKHVVFPGLEHVDLTAPATPWIAYGGSYAGALVAVMRKLYPDVFWGAIASSAVTHAANDFSAYYLPVYLFSPPGCSQAIQTLINVMDTTLMHGLPQDVHRFQDLFGLSGIKNTTDFATTLEYGVFMLQWENWNPAHLENSNLFQEYCANVTSTELLYPELEVRRAEAQDLIAKTRLVTAPQLATQLLNWVGFINATQVAPCEAEKKYTVDECFSNYGYPHFIQDPSLDNTGRLWSYQACTEFGFNMPAEAPPGQMPVVSRLHTIEFDQYYCTVAFNLTKPADVEGINRYGGFDISYPRLALIGGERDPWRGATPLAIGRPPRPDTITEPFFVIKDAVHRWDENGVFANETRPGFPPQPVVDAQAREKLAVLAWMDQWKKEHPGK